MLAERMQVSPVLAVVAYAMWLARGAPARQSARDRVHSSSVWDSAVFILNALAFLLMGLQARDIVRRLDGNALWESIGFAALVLLVVVAVRMGWVLSYRAILGRVLPSLSKSGGDARLRVLIGWSGMRGVLTMATAMSLPAQFPGRDLITLSAFAVVLGTLVIQGVTIAPLIRWLGIPPDLSLNRDIERARAVLDRVRDDMAAGDADEDEYARKLVDAQREALQQLLSEQRIARDAFGDLQEELDWRELSLSPHSDREIRDA